MTQRGAMGGPPVQPDGMSPSGARSPSSRPADTYFEQEAGGSSLARCPECEGVDLRVANSGRDSQGQMVRLRECRDCGGQLVTAEVAVQGFTFGQLNDAGRIEAREKARRKYGYTGLKTRPGGIQRWVTATVMVMEAGQLSRGPEARRLRAEGLSFGAIAARLGISKHTAQWHCQPNREEYSRTKWAYLKAHGRTGRRSA